MVSSYIQFEDADTKESLINNSAINTDDGHEISYKEAAEYNVSPTIINIAGESFKEFQYFTGLTKCQISGTNLRILTLPPNIQSKGYGTQALTYNCPNLEELIIIAPFNSNCDYPFSQNTKLKKVTIINDTDDILTSNLGYNGWFSNSSNGGYFYYNNAILEHIIVNNTTSINNCIFRLDKHIKSINCNNKIRSIGSLSFFGSKLEEITNTNSVTYIGESAFSNTKLKSAVFNSITSSILGVFALCTDLINVELQSATTLGLSNSYGAFDGCTNLESCDSPNLTNIGDCSFRNCNKLVSLNCSPITIRNWAFYGCSKFEGFISTSNITSIGTAAFASCPKFDHKDFNNVTYISISSFSNSGITNVEFKNQSFVTIPGSSGGNIAAGTGAFDNCTKLTKIDAPYVTSVGQYGFRNCSLLVNANIDWNNVTNIKSGAFANCSKLSLNNWTVPDSLIELGSSAFINSNISGTLTIPSTTSLTELSASTFKNSKISSIIINNPNITTIPSSCFYNCSQVTYINAPYITELGTDALGCEVPCSSKVVDLPVLKKAGIRAFRRMTGTLNIPNIEEVGQYCFLDGNITPTITPSKLKIIGNAARLRTTALEFSNLIKISGLGILNSNSYIILSNETFPDGQSIVEYSPYVAGNGSINYIEPICDAAFSPLTSSLRTIYVPDNLLSLYLADIKWSTMCTNTGVQIKGISELNT